MTTTTRDTARASATAAPLGDTAVATAGSRVSEELVFQAARRLEGRQEKVTAVNVRGELGGGSYSTIVPLVRAYHSAKKERAAQPLEDLVPAALRDALVTTLEAATADARAMYEVQLREAKAQQEETDRLIVGLESDCADLRTEVADYKAVIDELRAEAFRVEAIYKEREAALMAQVATAHKAAEVAAHDRQHAEAQAAQARATAAQSERQVQALTQKLETASAALDTERTAHQAVSQKLAVAQAQGVAQAASAERLERDVIQERAATAAVRQRLDGAQQELQQQQRLTGQLEGRCKALEERLAAMEKSLSRAQKTDEDAVPKSPSPQPPKPKERK